MAVLQKTIKNKSLSVLYFLSADPYVINLIVRPLS